MKIDTSLLKSLAKQGAKTLILILFLTGMGVCFNWMLLAFLSSELEVLLDISAARVSHGGGIIALILLVVINWQACLLFLTFFLVFPILHFLFAKKYAVSKAIQSLLRENKSQFVDYLLQKFFEKLSSKLASSSKQNLSEIVQAISEQLPNYLKKLDGIPFPIRIIIRFFLSKLDFMGIVSNTINQESKNDISEEELMYKISAKINEVIDEKFFSASFFSNGVLYFANIVLFIIIKIGL